MQLVTKLCLTPAFDLAEGSFLLNTVSIFCGGVAGCVSWKSLLRNAHQSGLLVPVFIPGALSHAILSDLLVNCFSQRISSVLPAGGHSAAAVYQQPDVLPTFILETGLAQKTLTKHPWLCSSRRYFFSMPFLLTGLPGFTDNLHLEVRL